METKEKALLSQMANSISDMVSRVTKMEGVISNPRGETRPGQFLPGGVVEKVFGDGRGNRNVIVGVDGADTLGVLDMPSLDTGRSGRRRSRLDKSWRAMVAADERTKGLFGHQWDRGKDGDPREWLMKPQYGPKSEFLPVDKAWGKQKASLAEGAGFSGGYTVPTQFYADLLRLMAEKAFVRDRCTVLPMQSRSLLVPALKQSSTVFARGQSQFFGGIVMSWTPEQVVLNESDPVFREVELVARDLTFVTVASNQLLQDNAVALDTLLTTLFQEAVAWSYDYYILQGKLANEPQGVINAPGSYIYPRQNNGSITVTDIITMLAHLYTQSWDNACWIANPSTIPTIATLTTGTGGNFFAWLNPTPNQQSNEGPLAQKFPAILTGLPIFWSEKASFLGQQGDLVLADYSKYLLGDRLAIQIEVSPHVRFTQNQMMWRVIVRWDGTPWQDAPITLADQSWQVSPMVILK